MTAREAKRSCNGSDAGVPAMARDGVRPTCTPVAAGSRFDHDFSSVRAGDGVDDAEAKYRGLEPRQDATRIQIKPVPDFTAGSLKRKSKTVGVAVSDPMVKSIEWSLLSSDGSTIESSATKPDDPDATSRPFELTPAQFPAKTFKPGRHLLVCLGIAADGMAILRGLRDFNVLQSDLKDDTARGTYGEMTFTRYYGEDAIVAGTQGYAHCRLRFMPDKSVACDDIAFAQAAQTLDFKGATGDIKHHPEMEARSTPEQWSLDKQEGTRSPWYMTRPYGVTNRNHDDSDYGTQGHGGPDPAPATMGDMPNAPTFGSRRFESCAICRSGAEIGSVYGCATWGYTYELSGKITMMPRSVTDAPSEFFVSAAKAYNAWNVRNPVTYPARDEMPDLGAGK